MPPILNTNLRTPPTLRLDGTDATGRLLGAATPGTVVEAVNLSTGKTDTFELARADASGAFSGNLPGFKEGDFLRLRARDGQGGVGTWLTVRAGNLAQDARNAPVDLAGISLEFQAGSVRVTNAVAGPPASEPEAWLALVNTRTGESQMCQLDGEGRIPPGVTLSGVPGDAFSLRASDGVNNLDMAQEAGTLTLTAATGPVELPDPAAHAKQRDASGASTVPLRRFTGPLFLDGAAAEDVKQGYLGDCYLASSAAALAHAQPGVLPQVMQDLGNGVFSVRFQRWDAPQSRWCTDVVTVDADLYARPGDRTPYYGRAAGESAQGPELWWPIFEKAYAQWKGSYDTVGGGGHPSDVFSAVLARPASWGMVKGAEEQAWTLLKTACDAKLPACAATYGESEATLYTNSGVHGDHAYTVLGVEEANGQRTVQLRNPWGFSEPTGNGVDDGVFKLPWADFTRLFACVYASQ